MGFSIILTVFQYMIFFLFLVFSAYYVYQRLTSKEERKFYRVKLQRELKERSNNLVEKNLNTPLQNKIEIAGIKYLNAFRYQLFRMILSIFLSIYYVVLPYIEGKPVKLSIILIVFFVILTEPRFKYSLVNLVLNFYIGKKHKAKIIELFTLFDILKAELYTLKEGQEVNVYSTLKDISPMFKHIQGTLSKFLSMWKRSPKHAKEIFQSEIGGESARTLGDILYKLDNVSRNEALKVIEAESSVFSVQYYQRELQRSDKSSTFYFGFFLLTNVLIVVWLIVYVFVMFNDRLNGTNNNLF